MRPSACLLVLVLSLAAAAQEEQEADQDPGDEASAPMMRPALDSPEAVHARSYDGPRERVQAFLIPMDENARAPTTRVAQSVEEVLLRAPVYEVVDLGRALSVDATAEQAARADQGRQLVAQGNAAAAAQSWSGAAARYAQAQQAFDGSLPAVGAREYADAVLRLGAARLLDGDEVAARDAFALVARLDPRQALDARALGPSVESQLQAARALADAQRRGTLLVATRPAGARVLVDGEPRGSSSAQVTLTAGRHLLRLEKPGFYPVAQLVDVSSRRTSRVGLTLAATPTAASLSQIIAGASDEVGRGAVEGNVLALAEKFSLSRVLVGSVRTQDESKVSVVLALVDAPGRRILAAKTLTLVADGTDEDQVEAETAAAARACIAQDSVPADAAQPAPDPQAGAGTVAASGGPARRAIMPGALPPQAPADEPGLVQRERRVVMPAPPDAPLAVPATGPAQAGPLAGPAAAVQGPQAAPAQVEAKVPAAPAPAKDAKEKGLRGKTGTEDWGDLD